MLNAKPRVEDVRVQPSHPVPGERLTVSVKASDPDGDPIELLYQWRVDGRRLEENGSSFHVGDLRKGSVIEVTVIARDGREQSLPFRSSARVANRPPVLQGVVIEPLGPRNTASPILVVGSTEVREIETPAGLSRRMAPDRER